VDVSKSLGVYDTFYVSAVEMLCTRLYSRFTSSKSKCNGCHCSKVIAVTTHQANQSQFTFTRKLVSCYTHLQSFAKIDNNETILEKSRTVAKNNWQN